MLLKTLKFIEKHSLFNEDSRILLAISGGMDSMVLFHMLYHQQFNLSVAHVNYQLRDSESDKDEALISNICNERKVQFHHISFDTKDYCKIHKMGIQEAARNLRYDWFNTLIDRHKYDCIVTAHHLNDNIETSIHHFSRGAGLKGLKGMLPKNNKICRPLLNISKQEIAQYASTHQVKYREDASNDSDNYTRNKIRHHITPTLDKIYPKFTRTSGKSLSNLRASWSFYDKMMSEIKDQICSYQNSTEDLHISISSLYKYEHANLILFETLSTYGFNRDLVNQIYECAGKTSGQIFHSSTHSLIIERDILVITKSLDQQDEIIDIPQSGKYRNKLGELNLYKSSDPLNGITASNRIQIKLRKSDFPLHLRSWNNGDRFRPIGMEGSSKKIKKYLTDLKIAHRLKPLQQVLTNCQDEIIWVVGHRQDIRFSKESEDRSTYIVEWTINS